MSGASHRMLLACPNSLACRGLRPAEAPPELRRQVVFRSNDKTPPSWAWPPRAPALPWGRVRLPAHAGQVRLAARRAAAGRAMGTVAPAGRGLPTCGQPARPLLARVLCRLHRRAGRHPGADRLDLRPHGEPADGPAAARLLHRLPGDPQRPAGGPRPGGLLVLPLRRRAVGNCHHRRLAPAQAGSRPPPRSLSVVGVARRWTREIRSGRAGGRRRLAADPNRSIVMARRGLQGRLCLFFLARGAVLAGARPW